MDTNAELNARLLNLIDWIGSVGKEIEAGAREQVPELARELIAWGFWGNIISAFGLLLVALIFTRIAWWGFKNTKRLLDDVNPCGAFTMILGAAVAIIGWCAAYASVCDAIKVKVAPRVYLVETASKWIK